MKYIFFLAVFCLTTIAWSQRGTGPRGNSGPVTVYGNVLDKESGAPLEFATIAISNQNGEVVSGGITDAKGKYSIEVPAGVYTIRFEFISYKTEILENQRLFKSTKLPNMTLSLDTESLDEVVVRAETTEVQIRLDKKVYTIGKDLTTSGATVSDALDNVPSVTVDVDGTIALRGNENVRILINGRPSAIAGFGSTDALRQLPAEAIERVEVITSPSARYDAEGTAGILNIILRKEKTLGLNGSVQTNFSYPLGSGVTGNINVRTNKFNVFNTTGVRYRDLPGNANFENRYFNDAINPLVIEDRDFDRVRRGFNTNLGIEYFLTKTSSITASAFYRLGDNESTTTNITQEFDTTDALAISRDRIETEGEDDNNFQLSLNYVNDFNPNGHKLTVDFQYETGEETETSLIEESNTIPALEILPSENIVQEQDESEYLVQADYVLPIGENAQFEAGYRGRFENTLTDYLLEEQLTAGGNFVRNDSLSNVFDFTQNVQALYSQYGNKFGKFSFLLGLRMESTVLKGEVSGEDVTTNDDFNVNFDKDFLGLFPTVNLVYEIGERENISFGYNRRINRPRFWFLNPFPSRSSEANVFQGNPGLDPAYASAFDLGYLKRWGRKLTLTASVYYQYETDAFERVQEDTGQFTPNGIPIIRTIPINLSTNQRIGGEMAILYNPLKWFRFNGSFNFFRFETEGSFNGIDYGTENTSWFARGSAKVTLPAKIDWQTNAFYRGPRNNAQTETEGILSISLAFSKDIINDNATIGFNVSDLFNSRKRMSFTETANFTSDSEFQWRERQFNLAFTYRFNQKKQRQRNGRNGGDFDGEGFEGKP
ncbi:TonB-dependent receptor [Aureisphaera galaxeae]|uniref:outer membrane beta-barrel protein n=1 Tax=Aureisphaera galaxeae TaxID=1538023 RepID=UPI0023501BE8|nr:outer membrane beta-barrel protein [Aureisphaera galaxeae]MDC8003828.1 TonB-dependent receptor [Aureisphaera galaxeae]